MKIGLVLPEPPKYSETFFNYKIRGLIKAGHEVIVFSGSRTTEIFFFKHVNSFPVYEKTSLKQLVSFLFVIVAAFIRFPNKVYKLISLEKKDGASYPDALKVVYINAHIFPYELDWLHFGFATMTIKRENIAKTIGAKMSISFRGYDINVYPLKNPTAYSKLWKKVDKVHTISDYLYRKALRLGLRGDIKLQKITPAIDLSLFKVKNCLGCIQVPLRILTIGRLSWIKDYESAISAMNLLKSKGIEFTYNIVGTGVELERLRFAVYQYKLDDRVFFLGQINHEEITKMMQESDIYLQTSYEEGFCVSVLEAQATGLLCIVSDAEGLKENIVNGKTGWIVPKRNPEAFANKIVDVINLPADARREMAINARKRVEDNFRIEDQAIEFKKFFEECV